MKGERGYTGLPGATPECSHLMNVTLKAVAVLSSGITSPP